MTFAKWVFRLAGLYGVAVLAPMFFLEGPIGRATAPVTHPEYFYGWIAAALVFQVMFLVISLDPLRHRPMMAVAMLEKFSWIIVLWTLAGYGRVDRSTLAVGSVDLVWGVLFVIAYTRIRAAT